MKTCMKIMAVSKFGGLIWLISRSGTMYLVLPENIRRGYTREVIAFTDVKGDRYCIM